MILHKIKSLVEYSKYVDLMSVDYAGHLEEIERLIPGHDQEFTVSGYSYPARQMVNFVCDFKYGAGFPSVNWRERVVCPVTHLNNRTRACIHMADTFLNLYRGSAIYLMEQVTPLYSYLRLTYPGLIGSEFLGLDCPPGMTDERGLRHEDSTRLSFEDECLDAVMSFDVFEHVPDFQKAFSECCRVLRKRGTLLFSVPFAEMSIQHIIRARVNADGSFTHLLPPEYHGDPIGNQGILCYQHFGWQMMEDLRQAGFEDAYAIVFWSRDFGYLTRQILFLAVK